ncbi:MAG: hypothetical protein JST68_00880 [Bacteroidetes bacterium]|nr:hypothetical protein [Bacteroidota bacterium]
MITLYAILAVINAIATIIFFFLYVKARMAFKKEEQRYLSLHFITLFLFVLFGVLILIRLSDSINSGASYSTLLPDKLTHFL